MEGDLTTKFEAAVAAIKSLPKDGSGSFKPSRDTLLKFYAYYKVAVDGSPENISRPSVFDPVGRAKYDAWTQNAHLTSSGAKQAYVNLLKEFIEMMPQSDEVINFTKELGDFYTLACDKSGGTTNNDGSINAEEDCPTTSAHINETKDEGYSNGNSSETHESTSPAVVEVSDDDQYFDASGVMGNMKVECSELVRAIDDLRSEVTKMNQLLAQQMSVDQVNARRSGQPNGNGVVQFWRKYKRVIVPVVTFVWPFVGSYFATRFFLRRRRRRGALT